MPVHNPSKPRRSRNHRQSPRPFKFQRGKMMGMEPVHSHFGTLTSITVPIPHDAFTAIRGRLFNDFARREEKGTLQKTFREHVERWKEDTEHYSSLSKMIIHPSYMRIMGMGPAALPLILRELKDRPDHWFVALNAITGLDPVPAKSTFDEAVSAWLTWGATQGLSD